MRCRGRPSATRSANFIAVLLSAAAVLGALWWTGAITPRLHTSTTTTTTFEDSCTMRGSVWFRLSNPTPFAVEVTDLRVEASWLRIERVLVGGQVPQMGPSLGPPPTGAPVRPFRLARGGRVAINAHGRVRGGSIGHAAVTVTARTPLALTRTAVIGHSRIEWGFDSSGSSC